MESYKKFILEVNIKPFIGKLKLITTNNKYKKFIVKDFFKHLKKNSSYAIMLFNYDSSEDLIKDFLKIANEYSEGAEKEKDDLVIIFKLDTIEENIDKINKWSFTKAKTKLNLA